MDDLNQLYFSNISKAATEKLLVARTKKELAKAKSLSNSDVIQVELDSLKARKQKALDMLLDEKIDQDAYDGLIMKLNPKIEQLVKKLENLKSEASGMVVDEEELKAYILSQLNPKKPIKELTPTILVRFIHKITVKADGQLEVHYRTSKPSAFYVSTNIKLDIPKTHPNKAYVEKHA